MMRFLGMILILATSVGCGEDASADAPQGRLVTMLDACSLSSMTQRVTMTATDGHAVPAARWSVRLDSRMARSDGTYPAAQLVPVRATSDCPDRLEDGESCVVTLPLPSKIGDGSWSFRAVLGTGGTGTAHAEHPHPCAVD